MRPLTIALLAIVIATAACKKEKANVDTRPAPKPITNIRLTKITETSAKSTLEHNFIYNNAGYLAEYTIYIKKNDYDSQPWEQRTRIVIERDKQNRAIKEERSYPLAGLTTGTYLYGNKNQLSKIEYRMESTLHSYVAYNWQQEQLVRSGLHYEDDNFIYQNHISYDANGNVRKIEYERPMGSNLSGKTTTYRNIKYDDKPNYVRTIKGLQNFENILGINPQTLSNNNMISYESSDSQNATTNTVSLTYNDYDYVEKMTWPNSDYVREFFYEEYE